jgi:hypothetical protein
MVEQLIEWKVNILSSSEAMARSVADATSERGSAARSQAGGGRNPENDRQRHGLHGQEFRLRDGLAAVPGGDAAAHTEARSARNGGLRQVNGAAFLDLSLVPRRSPAGANSVLIPECLSSSRGSVVSSNSGSES